MGYFTVPSIAGYIIHPGGNNGLLNKITNLTAISVSSVQSASSSAGSAVSSRMADGLHNIMNMPGHIRDGYQAAGNNGNTHQAEKLNGNPKK